MKKTVRVLLAMLLAVALLALTACSNNAGTKTSEPTAEPTAEATAEPTEAPTEAPTEEPTAEPSEAPSEEPTAEPTAEPTEAPSEEPTEEVAAESTDEPEAEPVQQASEPVEQPAYDFTGTTLTVFNWYDYIDPEVIDLFEEETGAKVEYVNFTTNEEMYTKLEAGAASYDVIFPSDYMIERMMAADMLEELDTANMPNLSGIIEWLQTTDYDPEGKFSVPYMWGTLGILYNTDMVEDAVDSWNVLFDEKYAGQVIMMNSQRDTIGLALKKLGYSMNTREESELNEAKDVLVAQKKSGITSGYLLDETKDKMVGNEAALAVVYSGDALYAMDKNEKLNYAVPKEGSNIWIDGMCIPKGSANKACAEAFIDFMCREDIARMNMDYICYSTPIQSVADSLQEEDERVYAVMNPDAEVIARCEFFHDIMDVMDLYESVWMEIRLVR